MRKNLTWKMKIIIFALFLVDFFNFLDIGDLEISKNHRFFWHSRGFGGDSRRFRGQKSCPGAFGRFSEFWGWKFHTQTHFFDENQWFLGRKSTLKILKNYRFLVFQRDWGWSLGVSHLENIPVEGKDFTKFGIKNFTSKLIFPMKMYRFLCLKSK